jgi:PAS domain S-box-containing protein
LNFNNLSREDLLKELLALQQAHEALQHRYEKETGDLKQAEIRLRESQDLYRLLVENQNDLVVKVDKKGRFLYVSPTYCKLFGKTETELLGKSFMPLVHPDDQAATDQAMQKLFEPPHTCQVVQRAYTAKGWRWLEWQDTAQLNEQQQVVSIIGIARDITERRQAEEAIKRERFHFEHLFQSVPAGIVLLDQNDCILDLNTAFSRIFQYEKEEARGKPINELIVPDHLKDEGRYATNNVLTGTEIEFESVRKKKDGKLIHVSIKGKPLGLPGNELAVIGVYMDISQRKQEHTLQQTLYNIANMVLGLPTLEELVRAIRGELLQLFDTSNFFVALHQEETNTLKALFYDDEKDDYPVWPAEKSLSGEVVRQGKTLLMNRDQISEFSRKKGVELLGTPAECWLGVPLFLHNRIAGVMVIQSYTNPTAYNEQTADFLRIVAHELSLYMERSALIEDLVKAKEKAEESDRLKSAFLANMSHEIRTPMNGILGFAEVLKNPGISGEQQQKFLGIIEKSGQRLLSLINDIVDISKIESGQHEVFLQEVHINQVMDYMLSFFQSEFGRKNPGVELVLTAPREETVATTDKEKLQSVLMNLIKNAMKFTRQGTVEFGFRPLDGYLEFFVKDTGIGIPEDQQKHVFDRFFQVDTSFSRSHEGTGLGLSISKAFVELLGGEISLESEPDKGSTFSFTIPVVAVGC